MKKLSAEEPKNFKIKGKRNASPVFEELINLKSGEHPAHRTSRLKRKRSPSKLCRYIEKKHPAVKYDVLTMMDKKGWV